MQSIPMFKWPPFSGRKEARPTSAPTNGAAKRLHADYRALAATQLHEMGIPKHCIDLDVGATAKSGRSVYNVKIRVIQWERSTGMRLLVSLPALEARMRKAIAASWLADVSDFGGIWVHASSQLPAPEVERDSQWAISELQAFDTFGEAAADRLRRELHPAQRARTAA